MVAEAVTSVSFCAVDTVTCATLVSFEAFDEPRHLVKARAQTRDHRHIALHLHRAEVADVHDLCLKQIDDRIAINQVLLVLGEPRGHIALVLGVDLGIACVFDLERSKLLLTP